MTTISFIGLGVMGLPMAINLQRAGFTVTCTSRSEESRSRGRAHGLAVVDGIDDLDRTDAVVTMLPDSPDVEAVLLDERGLFATAAPHTLFIDMSTTSPATAHRASERAAEASLGFVDAPVSGGEAGAIEGSLSVMAGGSDSDIAAAGPILEAVGSTIVHVGANGAGQVVKAANQLVVAGNLQMLAEAIVFLEAHGIELEKALDVLGGGLAGSTALDRKRESFLERRYTPGFRLELHAKDLRIGAEAASAAGVALPASAVVSQLVQASVARGDGGLDHSALLKLAEELSGRR